MDEIENPGAVDAHGVSDGVLADASDNTASVESRQGLELERPPPSKFLEVIKRTEPDALEEEANPSTPYDTADLFAVLYFCRDCEATGKNDRMALVRNVGLGEFFVWDGTRYVLVPEGNIRAGLYRFLETAYYWKKVKFDKSGKKITNEEEDLFYGKEMMPFNPNSGKVNQVVDALKAVARHPLTDTSPSWLDSNWNIPATDYVAMQNGRLHLPTYELEPHTPDFYNLTALPFDFNPDNRKIPEWEKFLSSVWPDNPDAIACLQEMFGYLVSGNTKLHKIMMIIGPPRSGKGTIGRVLNNLLGSENCCGPTLGSLAGDFGLAPLLGKALATIPDARFAKGPKAVVERLLMVTGEDVVSVNRKHKDAVTCILPTRFLILSNELPALEDASSALSSRFVLLTMTNSFLGREDHDLLEKLIAELPGILNWALDGWKRLNKTNRFTVPSSSDSALQELEELGSPVATFAGEYCEFDPSYQVEAKAVFSKWQAWCQVEGRNMPGSRSMFGRNFHAAFPEVKRVRGRTQDGGRVWLYKGVRLRIPPEIKLPNIV